MITDVFPIGVAAPGNNLVVVVPTLTTPAAPKLADIGATALDLTDYIKVDGWGMQLSQGRLDDTRLGDATKRETFDVPEIQMEAIEHLIDPQGMGTETGNKAVASLPASSMVYVVVRVGKSRNTALAVGDKVDVYTVTTGAEAVFLQTSGKYVRRVITSWTRVVSRVALVA